MHRNTDWDAASRLNAVTPLVPTVKLAINRVMDEGKTGRPDRFETSAAAAHDSLLRALIGRVALRDEAAFAKFYDATAARAYALARRITRDAATAEEVVSDVYFQVWQQSERYDAERGRVLAWLLTICRSRALDHLRRREPAQVHAAPDSLRPDLYRDDGDPSDVLLALERDSRVRAALATLNDNARKLLTLAFFRGLSHREISLHTGIPLGTVKAVLRRSMLQIKETLEAAAIAQDDLL